MRGGIRIVAVIGVVAALGMAGHVCTGCNFGGLAQLLQRPFRDVPFIFINRKTHRAIAGRERMPGLSYSCDRHFGAHRFRETVIEPGIEKLPNAVGPGCPLVF